MPSITSIGVGSGLDANTIVKSLMTLEQRPLDMLKARASNLQMKMSAFGSLKGQLAGLADIAEKLGKPQNWNPLKAESSNAGAVSATASNTAGAGQHSLTVEALAQAQVLASAGYAASTTVVGTGTLTLEVGTTVAGVFTATAGSTPESITINAGNQTLAGIRDAINAASTSVTASIVTSAGSSRLVLRTAEGAAGSIRLTTVDADGNNTDAAGLSALAWDPAAAAGAGKNLSQTQAAQDARFTVDGLALTSASNALADVLEGVTLSLKQVTAEPVTVTVSVETVAVRKNINDFINAYNGLNKLLQSQTQADPDGSNDGPLQGDSTAVALLNALRGMLRGSVTGLGTPASLSEAGIELQRDGSLSTNETRLSPLLDTPGKLSLLFSQAQAGSDLNSRGFGLRFKEWARTLTPDTGALSSRVDGLKRSVDANQKQQDAQQARLERTEAKLRKQYQRLDSDMSRLNAQLQQMSASLGLNQ